MRQRILYIGTVSAALAALSCGGNDDSDGTPAAQGQTAGAVADGAAGGASDNAAGTAGQEPPAAASCHFEEACGGELAGTWNIVGMCVTQLSDSANVFSDAPACAGSIKSFEMQSVSGTYTFHDDGTLQRVTGGEAVMDMELTQDCLSARLGQSIEDLGQACTLLDAAFNQSNPDSSIKSGHCEAVEDSCHCSSVGDFAIDEENIFYHADNGQLHLSRTSEAKPEDIFEADDYCVEGDTLSLRVTDDTYGTGAIILHRQ
jgi:hypothetical protein